MCALALGPVAGVQAAPDPEAQRKATVDKKIEDTQHALEETSAQFQRAYAALTATKAKLPAARDLAQRTESARAAADAAEAEASAELEVAKANEAKAESALAATRKDLSANERAVAGLAAQMYMQQGTGQLSVALDSQSPSDFADRVALADQVAGLQQSRVDKLATARAAQSAEEDRLSALRALSVTAQQKAQAALDAATSARDRAASAKAAMESLAATQQAQSTALNAQAKAERARLDALQAESTKLQRILAERARQAKLKAERERLARERAARAKAKKERKPYVPPTSSGVGNDGGYLSSAMPGWPVTSEFGMRFHPILHYWRLHSGMDFGAPCGTPIVAAASGRIIMAGYAGGSGNRVLIDHGIVNGVNLVTAYNHMSSIARYSGTIKRGERVGTEGSTGLSTGCHLHFEVLEDGKYVNPRKWL